MIVKVRAHEQRARAAQQGIRERLVGVGAGDGNAALRHGGRAARVRAAEQSHAERRAEGERRPHARFAREAAEPLDVVAARRRVPGAGVRVHEPPPGGEPRPHERRASLHAGRDPGARFDRPRVLPQAAVEMAEVGGGHPQGVEAEVGIGAEAQVLT